MTDERTINKDIDIHTFLDRLAPDRTKARLQIHELLMGKCKTHDNLDQILDEFAFNARFEAIYLYEHRSWVPKDGTDEEPKFYCILPHALNCPIPEDQSNEFNRENPPTLQNVLESCMCRVQSHLRSTIRMEK